MSVARLVFWCVVFLWWGIDLYVLLLKRNSYYKVLERRSKFIVTALIFAGVFLAISPESFREVWRTREFGPFQIVGTVVLAMGVAVRFIAIRTLGKYFTPDIGVVEGSRIVTKGLYKYVRHPSYTGEIIAFLGLAITFQHFPSSVYVFVFPTIAFVYRALVEEKRLIEEFGNEYLEYRKRTRMFI